MAFAHLSTTAVLSIGLGHLVFATAGSAVFAARGTIFAAISFGGLVLTTASGTIFAAGCAILAAVAFGHLILAASRALFAAGSGCFGRGLVSRSWRCGLRPHAGGEQQSDEKSFEFHMNFSFFAGCQGHGSLR